MEKLLGVVLCGGQSKRMGSDKGLLIKNGRSWAECIANKLRDQALPTAVSINETQQKAYQEIFPDTPLVVDQLPIDGPLDGLLSVHRTFPEKDLLLMACDMIDIKAETIQGLISTYQKNPGSDYYVYQFDNISQPFCAIYTRQALSKVYKDFEGNELKKYSLHARFEAGNTMYLAADDVESFQNYNS